jgi:hypothetical protein
VESVPRRIAFVRAVESKSKERSPSVLRRRKSGNGSSLPWTQTKRRRIIETRSETDLDIKRNENNQKTMGTYRYAVKFGVFSSHRKPVSNILYIFL